MAMTRAVSAVALVLAFCTTLLVPCSVEGQDALSRAKELYTSAAYDEALALLEQFDLTSSNEAIEVNQYRAFCLLALGRRDDASQVIQAIVEAHPSFLPSESQMSPRLQEAFRDVRRRVLPSVIRKSYAEAKDTFDRGDFKVAAQRFAEVVTLFEGADTVGSGELADLRMLSNGFLDLISTTAKAASPAPDTPAPPAAPETAEPPPAPQPPPAERIYQAEDHDITPPVPISQDIPPWRPAKQETQTYEGTLILVIDEQGDVVSVNSYGSLQRSYDLLLRRAASRWKFQPATKGGVPVKYRRIAVIRLAPPR
jgi:hypothetical protein